MGETKGELPCFLHKKKVGGCIHNTKKTDKPQIALRHSITPNIKVLTFVIFTGLVVHVHVFTGVVHLAGCRLEKGTRTDVRGRFVTKSSEPTTAMRLLCCLGDHQKSLRASASVLSKRRT